MNSMRQTMETLLELCFFDEAQARMTMFLILCVLGMVAAVLLEWTTAKNGKRSR